jgi:hypothetical protein
MYVTPVEITTEIRERQPWNAKLPMYLTLLGILTEIRELQLLNAA